MFVPRMRSRVLGVAATLALTLGGSVAAATSASAASATPAYRTYELCSHGTYASIAAWDYGVYRTSPVPPGECEVFTWPSGYTAYIWGVYSPGNNFLIGTSSPGSICTVGDEGPGDYSFTNVGNGVC
jgi:hypothetical protein